MCTASSESYRRDSERHQTCRPSGHAADQIRAGHQPQDRKGTRPRNPAATTCPRRRGDRVKPRRPAAAPETVAGFEKNDLRRRAQDQRRLGRCLLECAQENRSNSKNSIVRPRVHNRQRAEARQPVIGNPPVRPRSLSPLGRTQAQGEMMAERKHPAGPPMTRGNMRERGPYCYAKYSRTFASNARGL